MKPQLRILSIDGGGIRGIIPCTILSFIEQQLGYPLCQVFDLISGTSTGGIITMGLAAPGDDGSAKYSPSDLRKLYLENGSRIFGERQDDLISRIGSITKITDMILQKPYDEEDFEGLLKDYFGDTRLSKGLASTLVTSYEIQKGKPFYFSSRLASGDPKEDFLMREVCRSTSAAPVYFEPSVVKFEKEEELALVDGGVFANNPSVLAYSEAKELWKIRTGKAFEPVVRPDDEDLPFFLLSIGTGYSLKSIPLKEAKDWRALNWGRFLTDIFMRSVSESTDFTMAHLLPDYKNGDKRYARLNMRIPEENSKMDDVSDRNMFELCELAEKYIKKNESELLRICDMLG
ncbi:MAG: patatin-like phospholipase family protein [Ignavibacteria bacterium]|nr:patatin-like phospholipase family protein [Ignavibacteria bacterium]